MKTFTRLFLLAGIFVSAVNSSDAQQTNPAASDADLQAMIQAVVESSPPLPPEASPDSGTFYSAQLGDLLPPYPANVFNLPFWPLGDGLFIMDDRGVDYSTLDAEAGSGGPSSVTTSSLNSIYAYTNAVYLVNSTAAADGSGLVDFSFDIIGGTNNVPYDILMGTNVADAVSQWSWLGIAYTSNHYAFSNQPAEKAFYILAKPSNTMVVPWGDDSYGQCNAPEGITNALMVAGGAAHSLALLSDGTVVGWGDNTFGQGSSATNLAGVSMISAGWYHDVALLTNGTVRAWGLSGSSFTPPWNVTTVPSDLTNATVISAQAFHTLALKSDGTVVAWGYDQAGEAHVPSGLSNVVAISAGYEFNLAAKADGTVIGWGDNGYGQCNIPSNLSNVVDVAAGLYHGLALLRDGTVVAWGDNSRGETNVPVGLSNVVAIAAGGDHLYDLAYSLALKSDGTVFTWGEGSPVDPVVGLSNVFAIGAGYDHALAIRSGPKTPVLTVQPTDQHQIVGGDATFAARGVGVYGVSYQWQSNGVNLGGATNATLTLSNVQAAQEAFYDVVVTDSGGLGSMVSSNVHFYLVTPPVITSLTLPTNKLVIYQENLTLSVSATAPGQSNGFPLSYQWQFNGTDIPGATTNSLTVFGDTTTSGSYSVVVSNAAGSTNASWQVTMTYVGSYIGPGTLAYHLSTNAVAHTNGHTTSDLVELANWTYTTNYSTNLYLITNATWSPTFWLAGVHGLSTASIGLSNAAGAQGSVTMISPRHCIYANHMHQPPGYFTAAFLDTNNVIHWRTNKESIFVTNDISIGFLDSELPASVGFLPVLPTNYATYLPTNGLRIIQGIGRNQHVTMVGQPMKLSPQSVSWNPNDTVPFGLTTEWNVAIRPGDSSNPEMLLIGDQLVSVSHNWDNEFGPNYAAQFGLINQSMHYLSTNNNTATDYQLTPFALTNWPVISQ